MARYSRLHVEDVLDVILCGHSERLGCFTVTLLRPGPLDLLPGTLSLLSGGQRGRWGGGTGWGGVVMDELDLSRGGYRGRGRL